MGVLVFFLEVIHTLKVLGHLLRGLVDCVDQLGGAGLAAAAPAKLENTSGLNKILSILCRDRIPSHRPPATFTATGERG